MAASRVVRIVLTGDSAGLVRALSVADAASLKTQSRFEKMKAVGTGMTSLGRSMTTVAAPLVAIGAYSVKSAASFQQSMEMIRTQAHQSQREVNSMSQSVLNLAPSLGTSTQSLSDALYHIESAGYHGATALKMLRGTAELAKVGNANLTDTTNALDAAMVSHIRGVGNFQHALGMLNATVGAGDMHMQDLADAFGNPATLSAMQIYGVSLRDTGAALATFGDNNIRGAEAGTKLVSAIRIMAAPSSAAAKWFGAIGLSSGQLATDLRGPGGLVSAIQDLKTHLTDSGYSAVQQSQIISHAFGGRQAGGVQLLLNQLDRLKQKFADVGRGATSFGGDWAMTQKNVMFQWDKMKVTVQVALIKLGQALMPLVTKMLPPLVNGIGAVVKWVSHLPKPVLTAVVAFTAFLAIGGPILMMIGGIITAVTTIGETFVALGITLEAVPIIALFTAIGVGIYLLATHFQQVKAAIVTVFTAIGSAASDAFTAITGAASKMVGFVTRIFATLFMAYTWPLRMAYRVILSVFNNIGGAARWVVTAVGNVFSTLWSAITWPFREGYKIVKSIFNTIVTDARWVVNKVMGIFRFITNLPGKILGGAGSLLSGAAGLVGIHLHAGGVVPQYRAAGGVVSNYYAAGGPVGTDTVPAYLTPGEFVLNRAATARVGVPALNALNAGQAAGGSPTNITIESTPITLNLDGRAITQSVVRWTKKGAARGPASLTGGGLMVGTVTG